MKTIKNEKLIKRNGVIGQWVSLGALAVLGVGMYISFTHVEWFAYSVGALFLGLILTQIGMYMGNRWGRSPRPDEQLDAALKGLPGDTTIYHYASPVPHLLVGPAGIWTLIPYRQRGHVAYVNNRWKLTRGGFLQTYMSIFGQEGIGRPELEMENQIHTIKKSLAKNMEENDIPEIRGILVFTNNEMEIETNDAPVPALHIKKLKDFIRQKSKEKALSSASIEKIKELLPKE